MKLVECTAAGQTHVTSIMWGFALSECSLEIFNGLTFLSLLIKIKEGLFEAPEAHPTSVQER